MSRDTKFITIRCRIKEMGVVEGNSRKGRASVCIYTATVYLYIVDKLS